MEEIQGSRAGLVRLLLVEGPGEGGTEGGRVKQGANPAEDGVGKGTELFLGVDSFGENSGEEGVEEWEEGLGEEGGGGNEKHLGSRFKSCVGDPSVSVREVTYNGEEDTSEENSFF